MINNPILSTLPVYQRQFIEKVSSMAVEDMKQTKILASLTIAQAIIESNWGRSGLTVKANNLFGMKGTYNGEYYACPTKEWGGTKYIDVVAKFKKYPSYQESVTDHSGLFYRLSRYANLRGCTDYKLACKYVRDDGYATSPTYTTTLINVIEKYKLFIYDKYVLDLSKPNKDLIEYTVKKGDNLWAISQKLLGSGSRWPEIKALNSLTTNFLNVGQVLKIPEDCIIKVYIVKPTDESLWAICVRELGNGRRYPEVKELNGMITNELTVGQQLFLPKK